MTVLFEDVHNALLLPHTEVNIPHALFTEVLYADDTICCSRRASHLEHLLHLIEDISSRSGLSLNKLKCELLRLGAAVQHIHFLDGTPVPVSSESRYL
eukprot:11593930-Prorocentrum_lima.AAC.1